MATKYKTRLKAVEADTADQLCNKIDKFKGKQDVIVKWQSQPYYAQNPTGGKHTILIEVTEEVETP